MSIANFIVMVLSFFCSCRAMVPGNGEQESCSSDDSSSNGKCLLTFKNLNYLHTRLFCFSRPKARRCGDDRFRRYFFATTPVPQLSFDDPLTDELISKHKPVVIKGSNIVASANKWSLDYLRDNIGRGQFMVCFSDDNRFTYYDEKKTANVKGFKPPHTRKMMTFKQFYKKLNAWKPGQPRMYLQEVLKDGVSKEMMADFAAFNWKWVIDQQERNNWQELTSNLLLIGQEGSLTPAHYDEQENFLAQVSGTKRVVFFSPDNFVNLYPFPLFHPCDRQSQVDLEHPDFQQFPKAQHVKAFEAIVEPGDVVYIPPLWWHQIESAVGGGPTISLTFWYKAAPMTSIEYPLRMDQKVTMMRNIEKMMAEALKNDEAEITSFFRDLTLGRYANFPIDE